MAQLFNSEGEPVEVMDEAELKVLQEKADKAEALETALKEKEQALEKFSNKEFNFSKFREVEESKREEMLKGFSAKEKTMIQEIDSMRARQNEVESRYFDEAKEASLTQLAGEDKELKTKLEEAVKESVAYMGKPKSAAEVTQRYERAHALVMGTQKTVNPINRFSPTTGSLQKEGQTRFTDTPQGKAIFEEKFSKEIAKVKARNPNATI